MNVIDTVEKQQLRTDVPEFKPGDTVSYVKNPQYRDAANVYFDTVEIKGGGDAASAARAVCETCNDFRLYDTKITVP